MEINQKKLPQLESITFTPYSYVELEKAYKKAVEAKEETFYFENREFLTAYAKYVLEYLKEFFDKK